MLDRSADLREDGVPHSVHSPYCYDHSSKNNSKNKTMVGTTRCSRVVPPLRSTT